MCKFFSIISDGKGKAYWFDWKVRKKILDGKLDYGLDSHTSIADCCGFKGKLEDRVNKFEFNPLTKEFNVDQLNTKDDSKAIKGICMEMDWKKVVPQLIVKPIFNPFSVEAPSITQRHKKLLKRWDSVGYSVRHSVGDSVRDSVWDSVRDNVGDSVLDSVRVSVWGSVGDSVWGSVMDSVGSSVRVSVRVSIRDSVWACVGSFFILKRSEWRYTGKIRCKGYPFQPAVELWMEGLVPVFDGERWSLYGKLKGKVVKVYEK